MVPGAWTSLAELSGKPTLFVSTAGTIVGANGSLARFFCTPTASLLGQPVAKFLTRSRGELVDLLQQFSRCDYPTPGAVSLLVEGKPPRACLAKGLLVGANEARGKGVIAIQLNPSKVGLESFRQLNDKIRRLSEDVEQRIRSEQALEEQQSRLEELVNERTEELRKTQEELLTKEKLAVLGRLTATVSHELRNPLGTVRTAIFAVGDAIARGRHDRVERSLQLAERNIQRCDRIIGDLLAFGRKNRAQRESTLVDPWLLELLREQELTTGYHYDTSFTADCRIVVDQEQLRRAVVNLLNNGMQAVDASENPEKKLSVRSCTNGSRVEIHVEDAGIGVSEEAQGRLFEPMFSTKSFGVGLGLPIVHEIAKAHGGGIDLTARAGGGTDATIWFPRESRE